MKKFSIHPPLIDILRRKVDFIIEGIRHIDSTHFLSNTTQPLMNERTFHSVKKRTRIVRMWLRHRLSDDIPGGEGQGARLYNSRNRMRGMPSPLRVYYEKKRRKKTTS